MSQEDDGPKIEDDTQTFSNQHSSTSYDNSNKNEQRGTDFSKEIDLISRIKNEGNDYMTKDQIAMALEKYSECYSLIENLIKKIRIESCDDQLGKVNLLRKQIMSNLSLCYFKQGDFNKSIEIDLIIIALDPQYDKCYCRLYKSYKALGNLKHAVYFGKYLNKELFNEFTLAKYKEDIALIEVDSKKIDDQLYEEINNKKKQRLLKIYIFVLPIIVGILAWIIYHFGYSNKKNN